MDGRGFAVARVGPDVCLAVSYGRTCADSMHCCITHCRNKELLNEIQQKHKRLVSTMKQAPPLSDRLPY